jgi:hypothetical protein
MDRARIKIMIHTLLRLSCTMKERGRNLLLIVICENYRFFILRLHVDYLLLCPFGTELDSVALHLTHASLALILIELKFLHHFKPFLTMHLTILFSSSVFRRMHGRQVVKVSWSVFEHFKFLLSQPSIIVVNYIDIEAVIRHPRWNRGQLIKCRH